MDESTQNPLLDGFKQAWSQAESFRKVDYFEGEAPPTKSPHVNELIGAGRAIVKGLIDADEYRRVIEATKERLDESLKVFNAYMTLDSLPDEVKTEADRALNAFAAQRFALLELERYFEAGDAAHITTGNEMTARAAAELIAAYEAFSALTAEYSKVPCTRCGHPNPPDYKYCEKCRQDLSVGKDPAAASTEAAAPVSDIPPGFMLLGQALEGVRTGALPVEQFTQIIGQFRTILENNLPQMDNIINKDMFSIKGEVVGEELFQEFSGLAVGMKESILVAMAGITEIEQYITDGDLSALGSGWEKMLEGGRQMLQINRAMGALMDKTKDALGAESGESDAASTLDVEEKVELGDEDA